MPALREALAEKCARNNLQDHGVCVTNGANQAFVNLVLTLVDPEDGVVLFTPCYFDHIMVAYPVHGLCMWGCARTQGCAMREGLCDDARLCDA